MKILYISQYFFPEVGATSNRAMSNVVSFKKNNHDVTVLTEMPNHPKGIIFDDYKGRYLVREVVNGVNIVRVWVFTSQVKNFITRLLFYTSFSITGSIYMMFCRKKYDVVYVTSPPLFVAIIGLFIKLISPKTKMFFEVRDMWPDSAIDLGELKNKTLIKFSLLLENWAYKKSAAIITVTENLRNKISQKGFSLNKIYSVPNGTDLVQENDPVLKKTKLQKHIGFHCFKSSGKSVKLGKIMKINPFYDFSGSFRVIYAGNMGIAQNLTIILESAEILSKENIKFYFLGAGPEEEKLKRYVFEKQLKNVFFLGIIPQKQLKAYYQNAHCSVIPLRKIALFESAIPSKIFDSMAIGLPVIVGVNGEAQEVVKKSGGGLNFEPENPVSLSEAILKLKNNRKLLSQFGRNGIMFVKKYYDRKILAQKIEEIIQKHIND